MKTEPGRIPMEEPLAYFLTWTTYGTWLRGDERSWVEKPGQLRVADAQRQQSDRARMTEPPLTLDLEQRRIVEDTIKEHCQIRGWHLHAVSARTQHVHVVVTAPGRMPEDVMDQFKAWCTRRLKEHERLRQSRHSTIREKWWTQRGSRRWINDTDSLTDAGLYVLEGQGKPTPQGGNTQA